MNEKNENLKSDEAESEVIFEQLVSQILGGHKPTFKEWEFIQEQEAQNYKKPIKDIKKGDVVDVVPDRSFCTGGKEIVIDVTEDLIILESGHKFSREDGGAKSEPWAYHL
jgi:hypothetical protein